jgi:hypothetical protein
MRATRLAMTISDGMNCIAFGSVGALAPVVIALGLARKALAKGLAPAKIS